MQSSSQHLKENLAGGGKKGVGDDLDRDCPRRLKVLRWGKIG